MAAGNVVHSEAAKPSFRGRHGAGAQGIPAAVRPAASGGVHGRDEQAARVGSPREVAGTPRVAGEVRRPLPPPGSMHGVDVQRAAVRLADDGCHQTAPTLDWAKQVRALANLPRSRDAETITLVCDNLNTHSGDSFYAAFPAAAKASRLNEHHIHLVHTPKHGSWLNVAELEFSAFAPPVPGSPDREQGFGHVGNGGLGRGAQSRTDRGRLAAQRRRRTHQTEASISEN